MTVNENIVERIRKLLALSKSSNRHEAEAAMAKANALMEEHQIAMSSILLNDLRKDGVVQGKVNSVSETYRSFIRDIARAAAYLFDCAQVGTGEQSEVFFVGTKEDVVMAESIFWYLFDSWKSIVAEDTRIWKEEYACDHPMSAIPQYEVKKYKIGHGQGFGLMVANRAHQLASARKLRTRASGITGSELVILKDEAVKDWMQQNTTSKARGFKQQDEGFDKGSYRGSQIPLDGAIEETKKRLT